MPCGHCFPATESGMSSGEVRLRLEDAGISQGWHIIRFEMKRTDCLHRTARIASSKICAHLFGLSCNCSCGHSPSPAGALPMLLSTRRVKTGRNPEAARSGTRRKRSNEVFTESYDYDIMTMGAAQLLLVARRCDTKLPSNLKHRSIYIEGAGTREDVIFGVSGLHLGGFYLLRSGVACAWAQIAHKCAMHGHPTPDDLLQGSFVSFAASCPQPPSAWHREPVQLCWQGMRFSDL